MLHHNRWHLGQVPSIAHIPLLDYSVLPMLQYLIKLLLRLQTAMRHIPDLKMDLSDGNTLRCE